MKVPGSDSNNDVLKRVQESSVRERSGQRRVGAESGATSAPTEGLLGELAKTKGDTVTVSSLGSRIREELDPAKMVAERRAKIESLKEQIRNGTYAPPLDEVARSFSEEVSLEVLFSGGALKGE
jgi:anti-sigma28 factor (negative regulator of flagellin synthesis)